MNTREELRVFETFRGKGKAYKGEQFIADVDYLIKEVEETLDMEPTRRKLSGEVAGQRTIYGIIDSHLAESLYNMYMGKALTLHFEDGRSLDFVITQKLGVNSCLIHSHKGFKPQLPPGTPLHY